MPNLREIKTKIKSVKNLQKITRALEIVSTVKLQKTKEQADALKQYLIDVLAIISQISERVDIFGSEHTPTQSSERNLVIVVTSER